MPMRQPVRYYIQKRGETPTLRSVPVAVPTLGCAALAPAVRAPQNPIASPVVVDPTPRPSGVERLRQKLHRAAR